MSDHKDDGYDYDVFLSYKRHGLITPWIVHVVRNLSFWLAEDLGGRKPRIFFDQDVIETGDRWPDRIQDALHKSRCMVGIWAPTYFQSKWCDLEWRTFKCREDSLGLKTGKLILPLRFRDGEWFPEEVNGIQLLDVSEYAITSPAFLESRHATDLEEKIKQFSATLAKAIITAPPHDPNWPKLSAPQPLKPPKQIRLEQL